ncbi:2419_t:CDS:2 [Ambispora leptoticha]|uniref:2419_t:CDS:1 n=1 Tax=Ambispora leptoticha TaxID=144679 RepID=A0A9N8VZK2_9GLOM|nr:2419_t:CDS:2 [Ambispora leptoticha]
MKHSKRYRRLGRTSAHRMSMFRNMVTSLIRYDRIETTLPKAKELKKFADKMVTLGKKGDRSAGVRARAFLREHYITIPKLFGEMAERYRNRAGGYTRIHKIGNREGDNAPMAVIEYVDAPGDLKYQMLIKTLARQELEPELRIPTETLENGQGGTRLNKRAQIRLRQQNKFDHDVEKMMKAKEISQEELEEMVNKETEVLLNQKQEAKEFKMKNKLRKKKGHLSYDALELYNIRFPEKE